MIEDWQAIDEELIRAAAGTPVPPVRLRGDIVAAARTVCRRRRMAIRVVYAACLALPIVAGCLWGRSYLPASAVTTVETDAAYRSGSDATLETTVEGGVDLASAVPDPLLAWSSGSLESEPVDVRIHLLQARSKHLRAALE